MTMSVKELKKKAARICISFLFKRNTYTKLCSADGHAHSTVWAAGVWQAQAKVPGWYFSALGQPDCLDLKPRTLQAWSVDEIFSQESRSSHTWIVTKSLSSWMLFFLRGVAGVGGLAVQPVESYFPDQGSNPCPAVLEAWGVNHWTAR